MASQLASTSFPYAHLYGTSETTPAQPRTGLMITGSVLGAAIGATYGIFKGQSVRSACTGGMIGAASMGILTTGSMAYADAKKTAARPPVVTLKVPIGPRTSTVSPADADQDRDAENDAPDDIAPGQSYELYRPPPETWDGRLTELLRIANCREVVKVYTNPDLYLNHEYRVVTEAEKVRSKLQTTLKDALQQQKVIAIEAADPHSKYQKFEGLSTQFLANPDKEPCEFMPIRSGQSELPNTAWANTKGRRKRNEDVITTGKLPYQLNGITYTADMLAVFDGHRGGRCAQIVGISLPGHIQDRLHQYCDDKHRLAGIWNALKIGFVDASLAIKEHPEGQISGTAAAMAMKIDNSLWAANTGDSRIILVKGDGQVMQLTEDAKPDNGKFVSSIEKRESNVLFGWDGILRVGGQLSVARTLGNGDQRGHTARPKITRLDGDSYNNFEGCTLLVVSDGVCDYATSDQIGKLAHIMRAWGYSPEKVSRTLTDLILQAGPDNEDSLFPDNTTVVTSFIG
ncbi:PP2C family serine/threonine-protein phosphatase [Sansalvadorimonas verongulae]|uniref:PP2C family serine/threonine-protein phosphatase n=1 Tax=Sansalvadorimonas verongulae TaxID=2172824 RepID=UPI0018AD1B8F|nr:PP2C family protein-serine/threonine phosphatase [Sansalvadorimonas verongulae]